LFYSVDRLLLMPSWPHFSAAFDLSYFAFVPTRQDHPSRERKTFI
jgi:hypothetical protein